MKKTYFLLAVCLIVAIGALWLAQTRVKPQLGEPSQKNQSNDQIKIAASFYPLAEFAKQVGGEHVSVSNLTPAGIDPHDYEPLPQDLSVLYSSQLVFANGAGLDSWLDKLKNDLSSKGIIVVVMADLVGTPPDPHFWLDPNLAKQQLVIIRDQLVKLDPVHKEQYINNANNYLNQLAELDNSYKSGLAQCTNRTVVIAHDSFGYLAKAYNLRQLPIAGLSPDHEPANQDLAAIIETVKQEQVQAVYFESLDNSKLTETIAQETGAQVLELNPLEGLTAEQLDKGANYLSEMKNNLANLRKGLRCN